MMELTGKLGEGAAIFTTGLTVLEKLGMVARAADGRTPLEDTLMIEQEGRLVPFASGLLWPAAQLSVLILFAFAVTVLLLEEMNRDRLRLMDIDVDAQRRRRLNTVFLFTVCVALMISPPIP